MTDTLVIYHHNCMDGFAAAWSAWRKLRDDAEYVPAQYGSAPPDVAGRKKVYILDFSYAKDVMSNLAARHPETKFIILDHHKTAAADLLGLDEAANIELTFDMQHSGARLAWDHFNSEEPVPPLVLYAEDRDLWRFQLLNSRELAAWLWCNDMNFHSYNLANQILTFSRDTAISAGRAVLEYMRRMCEMSLSHVQMVTLDGHFVPAVNASHFFSELGELLCKMYPASPFAVVFFQSKTGEFVYSLRSTGDKFDVAELAKKFGGGGHKNAAGFRASFTPAEQEHAAQL